MFSAASLLIAARLATVGPACCDSHDDWRDELPPVARAAVARVDRRLAFLGQQPADPQAQPAAPPAEEAPKPKSPEQLAEEAKQLERHKRDIQRDIDDGAKYAAEIEKDIKLSQDQAKIDRVARIGAQLAEVANATQVKVLWGDPRLSAFPYQFKVIEDEDVNAFSIPGGLIYVHTGLLDFAESDHELAGVLAHEISHASFRHIATLRSEMGKLQAWTLPLVLASVLMGAADVGLIGGNLVQQSFFSGWSVEAETSADLGALQYMVRSPYNPVGVLTFMERLAFRQKLNPKITWGIYQTHPPTNERTQFLKQKLDEFNIPLRRSLTSSSLRTNIEPSDDGRLELRFGEQPIMGFGGDEAVARADLAQVNLDKFMDQVPGIYEIQVRADGTVLGRGTKLFEITDEDLVDGETRERLQKRVLVQMQKAAHWLGYRVWGGVLD